MILALLRAGLLGLGFGLCFICCVLTQRALVQERARVQVNPAVSIAIIRWGFVVGVAISAIAAAVLL